ncbi:FMN-binding split barrel, partial [Cynara cardunculus var. scolymus]
TVNHEFQGLLSCFTCGGYKKRYTTKVNQREGPCFCAKLWRWLLGIEFGFKFKLNHTKGLARRRRRRPDMLVIEPATAVRIPTGGFPRDCRFHSHASNFFSIPLNKFSRRNNLIKSRIRASLGELSGPVKQVKPQLYHPSEDISDCEELDENGYAILRPAEASRTIIEFFIFLVGLIETPSKSSLLLYHRWELICYFQANSQALLMFSGLVSDGVYENIFLPDLPYVKGEHGSIYFQVKNDEDILQTLASGDNLVVHIFLHHAWMLQDWVSILEDDKDSDGSLGDWAKLETMRSYHPMDFAKQLAEVSICYRVLYVPVNYMDQPPAGLAIQGLLRPAFVEEDSIINEHMFDYQSNDEEANQIAESKEEDVGVINGLGHVVGPSQDVKILEEESQTDQSLESGNSYYKLEVIKMQLISAHGNQAAVEVEDFSRSQPDAIAHSAAKILSWVKSGGDKTTQALKSLCWRCKGIQVEVMLTHSLVLSLNIEVALIGVDSLGFDVRVCSGRQVQTLRFAFKNRASSEYSVESQLNCLLFPIAPGKQQKKEVVHQSEQLS